MPYKPPPLLRNDKDVRVIAPSVGQILGVTGFTPEGDAIWENGPGGGGGPADWLAAEINGFVFPSTGPGSPPTASFRPNFFTDGTIDELVGNSITVDALSGNNGIAIAQVGTYIINVMLQVSGFVAGGTCQVVLHSRDENVFPTVDIPGDGITLFNTAGILVQEGWLNAVYTLTTTEAAGLPDPLWISLGQNSGADLSGSIVIYVQRVK